MLVTLCNSMCICIDCVCEMEADTKLYPNCFTVSPIIDDGVTRTYFISCCKFNVCSQCTLIRHTYIHKLVEESTYTFFIHSTFFVLPHLLGHDLLDSYGFG